MAPTSNDPLAGLTVFERGWLSSNNVLVAPAAGEAGALLVDTSHVNHAAQTVALVRHALGERRLDGIVNTHLHSDHCGGNAALQRAFDDAWLAVPPGEADAVRHWDEDALSYRATGQRIERYAPQRVLAPGGEIVAGGRAWEVIAAPGHDAHAVMLFDRMHGVLISADALWQRGFGIVFPEIAGEPGFDDVHAVLDKIARLPVRIVVPGHGAPFDDVDAALAVARERLAGFRREPARHARHALKVLVKYHLMEERSQPLDALLRWAAATPLVVELWRRHAPTAAVTPEAWVEAVTGEMVASKVLERTDDVVFDA